MVAGPLSLVVRPIRWLRINTRLEIAMLNGIKDGMLFRVPQGYRPVPSRQPHRYYDIGRTDELFIKPASEYYFEVVKKSPVFGKSPVFAPTILPIRRPDEEEYPANINRLRARFPALADLAISEDQLHFLLLHKLQYERLTSLFEPRIPDAAFVLTEGSTGSPRPTIVQRAIRGKTLFELMEQPAPAEERPVIAHQLQCYVGSPHIDWAFENFVWSPNSSTLFYVDSKPTLFRTERRNEENRRLLIKRFVRQLKPWWRFW